MAWFDSFAKDYDSWYLSKLGKFVDDVEKNLLQELADFSKGDNVLDIGAGTGTYSIWLGKKGLDVTALDQSTEMMKVAKDKADKEGLDINWILGDAHNLPFSDNTFDLVISVTAIEFMDNPKRVLEEAMRVLKPKGKLIIGVLTKDSPWGELYQAVAKEDPSNLFAKAHLYTEEEIADLLPYSYSIKRGLYIEPKQEFNLDEANKIEMENQREQAARAGYYVIRWEKE